MYSPMFGPTATCTATHPDHGACTRTEPQHERHASAKGSWYLPTTETVPARLRRLASEPTPPTVDSRVTAHYEGYRDGLLDAAEIAEVQPLTCDLPQALALLDRLLAPRGSYLSLTILPEAEADLALLLPGAQVESGIDRGLANRGVDVTTRAHASFGLLAVQVTHRRPAKPEELLALMPPRKTESGHMVTELAVALIGLSALATAILLRRPLSWAGIVVVLACAVLALWPRRFVAPPPRAERRPAPPPEPSQIIVAERADLLDGPPRGYVRAPLSDTPAGRVRVRCYQRERNRQSGHMLTELLGGLLIAFLLLWGCALLFGCSEALQVRARQITAAGPGTYQLQVTVGGAHLPDASAVLQGFAAEDAERLGCASWTCELGGASEASKSKPAKDKEGEEELATTTTIRGTLRCGGGR